MLFHLFWPIFLLTSLVKANVEKLVFLGPPVSPATIALPSLSILTPPQTTTRTRFHSRFDHTAIHSQDIPSDGWLLLSDLTPRRRYEVRICWPATQPTAFSMELYTLEQVMYKQGLMESLQAGTRMPLADPVSKNEAELSHESSRLFLHVKATADYFTMNQTLMENGLIVDVDIIFDEYIWNLAPSSLLPTGVYLVVVAVIAVFVSRLVLRYLDHIVALDSEEDKVAEKKTS